MLAEAKANPGWRRWPRDSFKQASDGGAVLFIENVNGKRFHDVFLAQLKPKGNARPSVVVADSGELTQKKDGSQVVTMNQGTALKVRRCYAISASPILKLRAIIGHQAVASDPDDTEQMGMRTLWRTDTDARAPSCTGASRWWRRCSLWR